MIAFKLLETFFHIVQSHGLLGIAEITSNVSGSVAGAVSLLTGGTGAPTWSLARNPDA
jgi:hypothetical protein